MKNNWKIFSFLSSLILTFSACEKVADLPLYSNGSATVLSSSSATIAPTSADAAKKVVTFTWTNPKYGQDESMYKFIIEIAPSGTDFAKPFRKITVGAFSDSLVGKELNDALLAFGFAFNVARDVDVRLLSSYGNNNERYASTNTLKLSVTPYKVPPKVAVPAALYIVGDLNGWSNNSSLAKKYYFSQTSETTFAGVFEFTSGGGYKLIQELGNWDTQFRMIPGGAWDAGEFDQKNADPTFPNPTDAGWYRIVVDFQNGTYSVTKTTTTRPATPPADLWIVGDVNGWSNNSGIDPKYKFTKVNDFVFTCNVAFTASGGYKLIQELGNWDTQFRMIAGGLWSGGEFKQENSDPTFPSPSDPGTYKITVNFATMTFSAVKV